MINAIILIHTVHGETNSVAETLAGLPAISEVYSVGGSYDVIAIVRVKANEQIFDLVTEELSKVQGIAKTETLIAFKAYSRHDLESVFSVGFDS